MSTGFIVLFFILHIIFTYSVHLNGQEFYKRRIIENKTTPKVYDIGMRYLPDYSDNTYLEMGIHIISLVLPFLFGKQVRDAYFNYIPVVFLIRYLFTSLTILPKDKKCDDEKFNIWNLIIGHCYDKIFSGHFAIVNLTLMILLHYGQVDLWWAIIGNLIFGVMIIMLRYHYTVDLFVAFLVNLLVYKNDLGIERIINEMTRYIPT